MIEVKYNKSIDADNIRTFKKHGLSKPSEDIYKCVTCGADTCLESSFSYKGRKLICVECAYKIFRNNYIGLFEWVEKHE